MFSKWGIRLVVIFSLLSPFFSVPSMAAFPEKPIAIIVPYAAGGGYDMLVRAIAPHAEKHLGVSVKIENIPGAGSKVGLTKLWKAKPDGYTLAISGVSVPPIQEFLFGAEFKSKDFTHIFAWSEVTQVLVVNPDKFKTLDEFIKAGKVTPLSAGVPGRGTASHLAGILAVNGLGIKVNWIPFSGGSEALTALAGRHIDFCVIFSPTALSLVRAGKIKPLLVLSPVPDTVYPDLPIPKQLGYQVSTFPELRGIIGPPKIPTEITHILEMSLAKAIKEHGYMDWANKNMVDIAPVFSDDFRKAAQEGADLVEKYIHFLK
ncbi:MAG: tripartite tricarboxylate transporter substrate binding protein [Desulfocucumaceae bacterium]